MADKDGKMRDDAIVGTQDTDALLQAQQLPQQLARAAQHKRLRKRTTPIRARRPALTPAWTGQTASPAQAAGMRSEDRVCRYLEAQGARVLARNLSAHCGEIDLACVDAGVLAFVEVRQRNTARYGGAAASVGRTKQQRLIRTAQVWLPRLVQQYFQGQTPPCRFDVVALQGDGMTWIKQAFGLLAD